MGDRPTLILTTRLGVRPLGVRGDALHNVADLTALLRTALESSNHVANDNGKAWRRARARRPKPMLRMVLGIR